MENMNLILASIGVFLVIILALVIILLVAKKYLSPSGNVNLTINGKDTISVAQGGSLLSTLAENNIYLPSACGGKGSCGQCKVQVEAGGGEILDSEKGQFTRKEIKEGWRLGLGIFVEIIFCVIDGKLQQLRLQNQLRCENLKQLQQLHQLSLLIMEHQRFLQIVSREALT
ncbi:MAG: 2Fe-2S iron-sulfur cluster binding domain-containing protein [Bacteroidaceae bacterium]|nr:2Fe-2S iron-sulfur cluster binding domain-containing protein [Bacteroidaceae bacterium]